MPSPDLCTEEEVSRLVHGFYASVRKDAVLGPVFEEHVRDWDRHLPTMVDFWSGALRGTARFRGAPLPVERARKRDRRARDLRRTLQHDAEGIGDAFDDFPPHARAIFGRGEAPLKQGDRLVQSDLARTFTTIAGPKGSQANSSSRIHCTRTGAPAASRDGA